MINRPSFLNILTKWKDKTDFIKIITGVRRCGKSTIFNLFQQKLKKEKINDEQIININFEKASNLNLLNWENLNNYIIKNITPKKMNYVFLDEIQMVPNFQKAVSSLRLEKNIDLYLTGSNAYMYSQKLSTLLSGRFVEIKMFPLSFKEFVSAFDIKISKIALFDIYREFGGFPDILKFLNINEEGNVDISEQEMEMYLDGVYNTVVAKDISLKTGIDSVEEINKIVNFLFGNIGNETSFNNVMNVINNEYKFNHDDKNLYVSKIQKIIYALKESFLFYQCNKHNLKGKNLLRNNCKYYAGDIGFRKVIFGGNKSIDAGHILENIVYLELLRRGYKVYTGKIETFVKKGDKKEKVILEVDFVAEKLNDTKYFQVALSVETEETFKREIKPLEKIKDNFEKTVLIFGNTIQKSYKGIKIVNVIDWLLE